MDNKVNVRRAYEAIAEIIGRRENVKITVVDIQSKEATELEKTTEESA